MAAPTRPRPAPGPRSRASAAPAGGDTLHLPHLSDATPSRAASRQTAAPRRTGRKATLATRAASAPTGTGTAVALREPKQVVASASSAVVAAAKVGRIFGRSSLRIAKQLPGVRLVETQASRISHAISDVRRILDMPNAVFGVAGNDDEQRLMLLVQNADSDAEPLRTAMGELLERSSDGDRDTSQDYLFGTIVSQLVPDEARILAALAGGTPFAVADLVAKQVGRSTTHTVLANASTVGHAAGAALPDNTPTYLTRLHGFGLVEFGAADDALSTQYDLIALDPRVTAAKSAAEAGRHGAVRLRRKSVALSQLGRDFWAASAPRAPRLA